MLESMIALSLNAFKQIKRVMKINGNKKGKEKIILEILKLKLKDFPEGTIVESENPDFIIENKANRIGVEVTGVYWPEYFSKFQFSKRPRQASESMQNNIAKKIKDKLILKKNPFLLVRLIFEGHVFQKKNVNEEEISEKIKKLIICNIPELNESISLRFPIEELRSIRIIRKNYFKETNVFVSDCDYTPEGEELTVQIKEAVKKKNERYSCYKRKCEEVWLAINFNVSGKISTYFSFTDQDIHEMKNDEEFTSKFERTFLVSQYSQKIIEI